MLAGSQLKAMMKSFALQRFHFYQTCSGPMSSWNLQIHSSSTNAVANSPRSTSLAYIHHLLGILFQTNTYTHAYIVTYAPTHILSHMPVKCWTYLRLCLVSRLRDFGLIRGDIGSPVCNRLRCVSWGYRAAPHSFCGWLAPRISSLVVFRWWLAPRTALSGDRCSPRGPPNSPDLCPELIAHCPSTANRLRIRIYILWNTFIGSYSRITPTFINVNDLK